MLLQDGTTSNAGSGSSHRKQAGRRNGRSTSSMRALHLLAYKLVADLRALSITTATDTALLKVVMMAVEE